jgi:hypothetical protein
LKDQGAGRAFYLSYWHPSTCTEIGRPVAGVDEVVTLADQAAELYLAEGGDRLAGMALSHGADVPENSLNLFVGPARWAIAHYADFSQTVTRDPHRADRTWQTVQFDEPLEIPSNCFIDRALAIATVSLWMGEDVLLEAAGFSDDLFNL